MHADSLKRTSKPLNRVFIIFTLGALSTVSPFSIDMYLASFPQMAGALHTSVAKVSLSLSSYFIGLAVGQICYGPFLDRFGRRTPLYLGLMIYILACIACIQCQTVEGLIFFRFIQALGGSAAQVAATTMVRDFFPVSESARIFSFLMLIIGVSPLLAPTIGGVISTAFGWHAVFEALAVMATLLLIIIYFWLPQSRPGDPSISLKTGPILRNFGSIFREPIFTTYTLAGAFSFVGLFSFVAGSPLIFMDLFQVNAQVYGAIFALLAGGFISGSQINIALTRRYDGRTIFRRAVAAQALFGLIFLILACTPFLNATLSVVLFLCSLVCIGISSPNAAALALAPFEKNAGSAAALMGFLQMGIGAVASTGIGFFDTRSALPTVSILACSGCIAFLWLRQREQKSTF